jgi:Spy/CpxP family protein refolding chaperone
MDYIAKNKWLVRGAAVMIFVLGFTAGLLAWNVYRGWMRPAGPGRGEDRFAQMSARLQLTAEQKTKMQQVLADTREQLRALRKESEPRVSEIRKQTDQRLQQILTPDQWQRFQQMRDEMRGRRGRGGSDEK